MGRAIIRLQTDASTGHGCFPPMLPVTASANVFSNGIAEVRDTDMYGPHCCPNVGCHPGNALPGSGTVFVNGLATHTQGAGISCGDTAAGGSPNVFAG